MSILSFAQDKYSSEDQAWLVATERAFANTAPFVGQREAFLTFFSDESISFDADFKSAKDALRKSPISRYPVKTIIYWMPEYGEISKSGDFGFLTGPWKIVPDPQLNKTNRYGNYFSFWFKNSDNLWHLYFDGGIGTPDREFEFNNLQFTSLSDSVELKSSATSTSTDINSDLLTIEKGLFTLSSINSNVSVIEK